jgi:hypothetical protein
VQSEQQQYHGRVIDLGMDGVRMVAHVAADATAPTLEALAEVGRLVVESIRRGEVKPAIPTRRQGYFAGMTGDREGLQELAEMVRMMGPVAAVMDGFGE